MSDENTSSFAAANKTAKKCRTAPLGACAASDEAQGHPLPADAPERPTRAASGHSGGQPRKLDAVRKTIARLIRRHRLGYSEFEAICKAARKETGLRRPARSRRLPRVLPEQTLRRYYEAVDPGANLQHQIMLRLLFYTAVRVSELAGIRVDAVDLDAGKIFIERGKGDKDRYILFPESFRLALKAYPAANPENQYLFESRNRRPYSTRRVQQIV